MSRVSRVSRVRGSLVGRDRPLTGPLAVKPATHVATQISIATHSVWGTFLHVKYVERIIKYGIRFIFSPFCAYMNLEYVRFHVIFRVNQAECVIRLLTAAPQEYVNTYSTRRAASRKCPPSFRRCEQRCEERA